ncbi:MAG: DctP family TRAP transporter solute-binding subunit [Truepera sp.]|nr:DctP family TRAP transporter solute-binding subunit [Truepera sp.]
MSKNRLITLLVAFALILGGANAQRVLKYTHFQPGTEDQPKHAAALAFKEHVEEHTGGSIRVEIFPAGMLGDADTVLQGLQLGTIELGVVHDGPITEFFPPIELISTPFLFESHAVAYRVFDGEFGTYFAERMLEEAGIRMMAFADNGLRHFTNNVRPIRTPEDMRGLTIRIMPSPLFERLVTALGASAITVPWLELPIALAQGVVDGQENSVTNILAASLYQYQRHVSLTGHVYSVHLYMMNPGFYDSLTPDEQRVIDEAIVIARDIHRQMTSAQDLNAVEILTGVGMEVAVLTSEELAAFREVAQPPVLEHLVGRVGQEWIDRLMQAVEAAQ